MRATLATLLVALPALALAQDISSLPQCVQTCLASALGSSGTTCSPTDVACLCTSTAFQTAAATCIGSSCDASDQQAAIAYQAQACGASVSSGASSSAPVSSEASSLASSISSAVSAGATSLSSVESAAGSSATSASSSAAAAASSTTGSAPSSAASSAAANRKSATVAGGLFGIAAVAAFL